MVKNELMAFGVPVLFVAAGMCVSGQMTNIPLIWRWTLSEISKLSNMAEFILKHVEHNDIK